jgi:hypothetical protein
MASASPPSGGAQARQNYLMQRLANREITMEEATELFNLMNRQIVSLRRVAEKPPPAAPSPPPSPTSPSSPTVPAAGAPSVLSLEELVVFGGAFSGILAALLRRASQDLAPPQAPPTRSSPRSRGSGSKG